MIHHTFLKYAEACEQTSRFGRTYEARLRAAGSARAYRTAAALLTRSNLMKTVNIRLKRCLDPNMPIVEAQVIEEGDSKGSVKKVVVTGDHKVWRGAELSKDNFKVVKA